MRDSDRIVITILFVVIGLFIFALSIQNIRQDNRILQLEADVMVLQLECIEVEEEVIEE